MKKYTRKQICEAIKYWSNKLCESKMSKQEYDDFEDKLHKGIVKFRFIKKDGSERKATGTLNPSLMPSVAEQRKIYSTQQDQFGNQINYDDLIKKLRDREMYMPYFWDLENNGYRQFHVSRFLGIDSVEIKKHKYEVTTLWYIPEQRTETVEATSQDEVDDILADKYAHYMNSHSESQEMYNGVYDIKEIN